MNNVNNVDIAEDEDPYGDEVCDAFSPIEQTDSGWQLPMDIPNAYFK